jgi:hypothetical protein
MDRRAWLIRRAGPPGKGPGAGFSLLPQNIIVAGAGWLASMNASALLHRASRLGFSRIWRHGCDTDVVDDEYPTTRAWFIEDGRCILLCHLRICSRKIVCRFTRAFWSILYLHVNAAVYHTYHGSQRRRADRRAILSPVRSGSLSYRLFLPPSVVAIVFLLRFLQ